MPPTKNEIENSLVSFVISCIKDYLPGHNDRGLLVSPMWDEAKAVPSGKDFFLMSNLNLLHLKGKGKEDKG